MIFHCCSQKEYSFILKLCIYITEDMTFLNKRLIQCASFYLCWYILWKVPVNLLLIEGLSFMFWGVAQWIKAFSKNWKAAVLNPSVCVHVFVCVGGGDGGGGRGLTRLWNPTWGSQWHVGQNNKICSEAVSQVSAQTCLWGTQIVNNAKNAKKC